ncbi:MAG: hypothetical protein LBJ64_02095 [Deltaproteobacteria bacterium]|nr:hypothetical protein [Deltaproteobacteria bacterium]
MFGSIAEKYGLADRLREIFGPEIGDALLALSWRLASDGGALAESEAWFEQFESPLGMNVSNKDVAGILESVTKEDISFFYDVWAGSFKKKAGAVLYVLNSKPRLGRPSLSATWGHDAHEELLPPDRHILVRLEGSSAPLFAWTLEGGLLDEKSLEGVLQFAEKLGVKPIRLVLDQDVASDEFVDYLFRREFPFVRNVEVTTKWAKKIVKGGRSVLGSLGAARFFRRGEYHADSVSCRWTRALSPSPKGRANEEFFAEPVKSRPTASAAKDEAAERPLCLAHVVFCHEFGLRREIQFSVELGEERERLMADPEAAPKKEFERFLIVTEGLRQKERHVVQDQRQLSAEPFHLDGSFCFLTNDASLASPYSALSEHLTRTDLEKDFEDVMNDLDWVEFSLYRKKLREARVFLQFLAEIFLGEIRAAFAAEPLGQPERELRETLARVNGLYKIRFNDDEDDEDRDFFPALTEAQRKIVKTYVKGHYKTRGVYPDKWDVDF